jgi:ADP-sugar diphosphatase
MSHFSALHLQVISSLQGQETGLRDHGELIKVHVVPYNTLWRSSPDAKALAAIALYEMALKLNLLPLPPNAPELSAL